MSEDEISEQKQADAHGESDPRPEEPRTLAPAPADEEAEAVDRDTERAAEGPITKSSSLDSRS